MAKLKILHFPDPRLRKKATKVHVVDETIRTLAQDMLETMYAHNGIGLAATQVNIQKRVVVMDLSSSRDEAIYLVNPAILASEGKTKSQEGCLSVPGYYDTVFRAESITFSYQDLDGNLVEQEADSLMAICVQHEIDHLNGKLYIDYLSQLKRRLLRRKIEKQSQVQAL